MKFVFRLLFMCLGRSEKTVILIIDFNTKRIVHFLHSHHFF